MVLNVKKSKLPESFRPLMWSYKFDEVDPRKDKEVIIVQTINYGDWRDWLWVARFYGRGEVAEVIGNLAASEFRQSALALAKLVFGIKKMQYATRSDKIQAAKNF